MTTELPYEIRHGQKWDSCRVRVWDPIESKMVFHSSRIPPDLKGKKLHEFCMNEYENFRDQVRYRTSTSPSNITFADYFNGEWSEHKLNQGYELTLRDYRNIFDVHLQDLYPIPLDKITPRHLEEIYSRKRKEGVSEDRIARMHKLVKQVLGDAKKRGIIRENVARDRMDGPRVSRTKSKRKALSESDLQRIIDEVCTMEPFWKSLFLVAIFRGMRREEIAALRWEYLLRDNYAIAIFQVVRTNHGGELIFKDPKSEQSKRTLPRTEMIARVLEDWRQTCGGPSEGFVFPSPIKANMPIYPDTITSHAKDLSNKLGINFTLHSLRHAFVTRSLKSIHTDLGTVQNIAGHSDPKMTLWYDDVDTETMFQAQSDFEKRFSIKQDSRPTNLLMSDKIVDIRDLTKTFGGNCTKTVQNAERNSSEPKKPAVI